MPKFKVGDRVRIKLDAPDEPLGGEFNQHRDNWDIAVVVSVDMYPGRIEVEFAGDAPGDGWLMKEDELEHAAMVDPAELNAQIHAYFAADFITALDDTVPAAPVEPEDTLLHLVMNEQPEVVRRPQYPFGRNGEALP